MMRSALLLVVALLSGDRLAAQEAVEARGITSSIKLEEIVYSHIEELNGKFKMRASEATFAPGAHLGAHHHVGPGVRYVLSGELTFTEGEPRLIEELFTPGESSRHFQKSLNGAELNCV
jgi:quercetin dioxygenase-like cupin family protein